MRSHNPARRSQPAALAKAGVGDQDPTCEHGVEGCPGPGGELDAQCFDCFFGGDESDA